MRQSRVLRAVVLPGWKPGDPKRYAWPLFNLPSIPEPTPEQQKLSKAIFRNGARWLGDHTTIDSVQRQNWTELAILGRSNVGKSSLLNYVLGSRDNEFVPVGKRPGMTVALDFYGVGVADPPPLVLVDTPGYGYSSRGKSTHMEWMQAIERYLLFRKKTSLARVMILLDSRNGITPNDKEVIEALDEAMLPTHLVLTKVDLLTPSKLESTAAKVAQTVSKLQMPFPVLNAVSSRTGEGMSQLQATLMQTAKLHRNLPGAMTADAQVRQLIVETAEAMQARALSAMAAFETSPEGKAVLEAKMKKGDTSAFGIKRRKTTSGDHTSGSPTRGQTLQSSIASAEDAVAKAMQALVPDVGGSGGVSAPGVRMGPGKSKFSPGTKEPKRPSSSISSVRRRSPRE